MSIISSIKNFFQTAAVKEHHASDQPQKKEPDKKPAKPVKQDTISPHPQAPKKES